MSHVTLLVSSASVTGNDKSQVIYRFKSPLVIPKDAVNPYCEVLSSQIWFNSPNITSANNQLRFTINGGGGTHTWVADEGLYGIDELNSALGVFTQSLGHPSNLISFTGRGYDGKLVVKVDTAAISSGMVIHWSTSSMATFLGFQTNADHNFANFATADMQVANSVANFNSLSYWAIEMHGLGVGSIFYDEEGKPSSIISTHAPATSVGKQSKFFPTHPLKIPISSSGAQINQLVFNLTDQSHVRVDTLGEDWSCIVQISWE